MIAVIDYGAGNLQSVVKAFRHIGCECCITDDPERLAEADAAVLPGQGAFGDAMRCLERSKMVGPALDFIRSGKPFLGICVGLQLLFESSEESPGVRGLSVFPGKILRIPDASGLKIPHIGWNSLNLFRKDAFFEGLKENPFVYFDHSYYLKTDDRGLVAATADYGAELDVAIHSGNVFAAQFHPEKSGAAGLRMLRNFALPLKSEG
ncbi:imidazole glycerol phosphate synthase subunit HisH [Caproicibacter fermentans]|uniref:Imidazole glycerol phosphate synthase subunit HisH n=1 Tax=Caproicibacter fermentans TaxID=2576756 RepID=A0A7G8TCN0_9FIRM|nr:imidazole glycerol phosphate synthase subunit HisH [Caproicibacter fermentans]QNK41371.1 imidazole glycerol phosphate synthase subunit HisH [Caproicibacter fermentans]